MATVLGLFDGRWDGGIGVGRQLCVCRTVNGDGVSGRKGAGEGWKARQQDRRRCAGRREVTFSEGRKRDMPSKASVSLHTNTNTKRRETLFLFLVSDSHRPRLSKT